MAADDAAAAGARPRSTATATTFRSLAKVRHPMLFVVGLRRTVAG
jgi:hypothetical protein